MQHTLKDKVVLVTGGASGIGRATALAFASQGAKVVLADVDSKSCAVVAAEIEQQGSKAKVIECDVADSQSVKHMVEQAAVWGGHLDFAVNSAGIEGSSAGVAEHTEEEWGKVMAINLTGVWLCMKYELAELQKTKGGAIVNVASAAGLNGSAGTAAYTASKHGVVGLTKSAALEYAPQGIRINAICPGFIKTPMLSRVLQSHPDAEKALIAREPMARLGKADEVAQTILALCSSASFVTGVAMPVDGGLSAL